MFCSINSCKYIIIPNIKPEQHYHHSVWKAVACCITEVLWFFSQLGNNYKTTQAAQPSSDHHSISDHHSTEGDAPSCISFQSFLSDDDGNDTECMPPLVSTARTPEVQWHQDECFVYIKIMLMGVEKYYIGCDTMNLLFRYEHL